MSTEIDKTKKAFIEDIKAVEKKHGLRIAVAADVVIVPLEKKND
jgi:hypothetical protein